MQSVAQSFPVASTPIVRVVDASGEEVIPIPIPISPDKLVDTADRLGAIDAVKRKLVKQPDPAAAQLVTVLEELSKIYGSMEEELTTYLSLFFDDSDPKQLTRERAALGRLEGGAIRARMSEARGRCSKIWNIYGRYLTPWFDRVLDPGESEHLRQLFRELSEIDSHMVDAIDDVANSTSRPRTHASSWRGARYGRYASASLKR
jgi:hypothetical protein